MTVARMVVTATVAILISLGAANAQPNSNEMGTGLPALLLAAGAGLVWWWHRRRRTE
jgi:high-affinity Fe2+/Pb2+ permease